MHTSRLTRARGSAPSAFPYPLGQRRRAAQGVCPGQLYAQLRMAARMGQRTVANSTGTIQRGGPLRLSGHPDTAREVNVGSGAGCPHRPMWGRALPHNGVAGESRRPGSPSPRGGGGQCRAPSAGAALMPWISIVLRIHGEVPFLVFRPPRRVPMVSHLARGYCPPPATSPWPLIQMDKAGGGRPAAPQPRRGHGRNSHVLHAVDGL